MKNKLLIIGIIFFLSSCGAVLDGEEQIEEREEKNIEEVKIRLDNIEKNIKEDLKMNGSYDSLEGEYTITGNIIGDEDLTPAEIQNKQEIIDNQKAIGDPNMIFRTSNSYDPVEFIEIPEQKQITVFPEE